MMCQNMINIYLPSVAHSQETYPSGRIMYNPRWRRLKTANGRTGRAKLEFLLVRPGGL